MSWESSVLNRDALPRIDLSQARRDERRRVLFQSRRDMLVLGCLLLFALGALMPLTVQIVALRTQLTHVEREADQIERRFQTISKVASSTDERLGRWNRYTQARQERGRCPDVLWALASHMPASVYLEQLFLDSKDKRSEVSVIGSAESMDALTGFVNALSQTPQFTRVRIAETSTDATMGAGGVRFRLAASLTGGKEE